MPDFSTAQFIQVIVALCACCVLFIISITNLYRYVLAGMIVMFPFQIIDTKYGSINVYCALVVLLGVVLSKFVSKKRGKIYYRTVLSFGFLAIIYAISFFYNYGFLKVQTISYLACLASSFAIFYLVYMFINTKEDVDTIFRLLTLSNILVLVYCCLQLYAGFDQFIPLGLEEFAFTANRVGDVGVERRLMGPFNAAEIVSEYFVLMNLILAFRFHKGKMSSWGLIIIFFNLCAIVGTGSRGGIIATALSFVLYLFFFRKEIKVGKVIVCGVLCGLMISIASLVMLKYTQFDGMYERLASTEVDGIVPDTRQRWYDTFDRALKSPVLGHGIRMVLIADIEANPELGVIAYKRDLEVGYPHSLYLYLFYTLGVAGLLGYGVVLFTTAINIRALKKTRGFDPFINALPTFGLLFLAIFLVDQFRIEFLRHYFSDFQHFIAIVFASILAVEKTVGNETQPISHQAVSPKPL